MSDQQPHSGPGGEPEHNPTSSPGTGPQGPRQPPPGDGRPYESPPGGYGSNPYGGAQGAVDPLAGMPPLPSRGRRLVARIIDALIVSIPVSLLVWPLLGRGVFGNGNADGRSYVQQASVLIIYFVYEGLMLTARGQTVGKMAMRIRVAMLENGAIPRGGAGWSRSAVYSLVQLLPCIGFLFWLLNVLFCTWDKPFRQCLHDKTAKTVVVSTA